MMEMNSLFAYEVHVEFITSPVYVVDRWLNVKRVSGRLCDSGSPVFATDMSLGVG